MDFKVERNDITNMKVDAIVCPTNPKLREGSGTSAAIFGKAGRSQLAKACSERLDHAASRGASFRAKTPFRAKGSVPVGRSVVTSAYELPAKIIIHTVVPKWRDGKHDEYEKLSESYLSALMVADRTSCSSLALPLLASGNMGFDLDVAIEVAVRSIEAYESTNTLSDVTLVTYGSLATQKMRDLGYQVIENIDEQYVQENDESYKPAIVHAANGAKNVAVDFVDKAVEIADEMINDDTVISVVKEVAVGVLVSYVSKKFPAVGGTLKQAVSGKKK